MVTLKAALTLYSGSSDHGNFKGRVQCMCSHPSLAWVATVTVGSSVESFSNISGANESSGGTATTTTGGSNQPPLQRVTLWDYQRGETLVQWSSKDLLRMLMDERSATTNLGPIRSVKFMDRHTLYWDGCHPQQQQQYSATYGEPMLIVVFELQVAVFYTRNYSCSANKGAGFLYTALSHTQLIKSSSSMDTNNIKSIKMQRTTSNASTSSTTMTTTASCNYPTCVQPIHYNFIIIGCSDGSIQFWNIEEKKIVHTVKAHEPMQQVSSPQFSGTTLVQTTPTAAILQIIPAVSLADLYDAEHYSTTTDTTTNSHIATTTTNTNTNTTEDYEQEMNETVPSRYRFVTVASDGIAYLWTAYIHTQKYTTEANHSIYDSCTILSSLYCPSKHTVVINKPLARIQSISISSDINNNPITTAYYDMERDLFFSPIDNNRCLAVWDFSAIPNTPNKTELLNIPLFSPFLRIIISPNLIFPSFSTTNISHNKDWILLPVQNPYYTNESCIAFWMANRATGDAYFMVSPIKGYEHRNSEVKPEVYHECSLQSLDCSVSSKHIKLKLNCFISPRNSVSGETVILCGTNCGIFKLEVFPRAPIKILSGTRHIILSEYTDTTKQIVILFVEGFSVFVATLDATKVNPIGPLIVRNPCLVYKSVVADALLLSPASGSDNYEKTKMNDTGIRSPPKLFLSPSKAYVCLFWSFEMRYEILHVQTLLEKGNSPSTSKRLLVPLIESGTGVRSFAWEGLHDVFAVLRVGPSVPPSTPTPSSVQMSSSALKEPKRPSRFDFSAKLKGKSPSAYTTPTNISGSGTGIIDTPLSSSSVPFSTTSINSPSYNRKPSDAFVELRMMISVRTDAATAAMASCAAATVRSMGELQLRGGQPINLFGGSVLCVASTHPGMSVEIKNIPRRYQDSSSEGLAYFYIRKHVASSATSSDLKASAYVASGPSLPIPDLLEWSEDGQYCCACFGSRIAIYCLRPPEFSLVGTATLSPFDGVNAASVESIKFLHGVLFCTTSSSVQLIFLSSISNETSGITSIDSHILASMHVPTVQSGPNCFPPIPCPMYLGNPAPLTFFAGSLVISTSFGVQAIPLDNPLYRIGILLAAGHTDRAQEWFHGIDKIHHEALARFLERRGYPELATSLPGLSITTVVDLCIRWKLTKVLEDMIEMYGLESIRKVDMGSNDSFGAVECIGAYLLGEGKAELVRRLASECVVSGDETRREALVLASLLLSVDPSDARRLVKRAVGAKGKVDEGKCWPLANYVRNNLL